MIQCFKEVLILPLCQLLVCEGRQKHHPFPLVDQDREARQVDVRFIVVEVFVNMAYVYSSSDIYGELARLPLTLLIGSAQ